MYAQVVEHKVVAEWNELPATLGDVTLTGLSDEELQSHGIYPIIEVNGNFNPLTHKSGSNTHIDFFPEAQRVVRTYEVIALTPAEAQAAVAAAEKALTTKYIAAVQALMDSRAQQHGYDDIKSAALRSAFPGPYHAEGKAFATWMDKCWQKCYHILADVKLGNRPIPEVGEVVAEMPVVDFTVPLE